MEDYGKITFRSIGENHMMSSNFMTQTKKVQQKRPHLKSKSGLSKKRMQTSSDNQQFQALKICSKHSSELKPNKKQQRLNQKDTDQQNDDQEFESASFLYQTVLNQHPPPPQEFQADTRQQNILTKKSISNMRYLISQTKQMMSLIEAQILQDDIRMLKSKLIETQINVRRLRIGSRAKLKSQDKHVIGQYYKTNGAKKTRNHSKNLENLVMTRRLSCEYYGIQSKTLFNNTRGNLLRARAKSIKDYIETEKSKSKKKQQLLKKQIQTMQKQQQQYTTYTIKTAKHLSGIQNKMSQLTALMLNSRIKSTNTKQNQCSSHRLEIEPMKSFLFQAENARIQNSENSRIPNSGNAANQYLIF